MTTGRLVAARARVVLGIGLIVAGVLALPSAHPSGLRNDPDGSKAVDRQAYGRLPLSFAPNAGQADPSVMYQAQAGGASFWFARNEAVFAFARKDHGAALRLRFLGSDPAAVVGEKPGTGTVNYLIGRDPAGWHTGVPTYGEVVYRGLWPRTNLAFHGDGGSLEYELRLAPGADPSVVRLAYHGAGGLSVDRAGNLVLRTALGQLVDTRPIAFQAVDGRRVPVESRYSLDGRTFGFELGAYDPTLPLIIDPGLAYSTFLGGAGTDQGKSVAVDGAGHAYVTGFTGSADFPTAVGPYDPSLGGFEDVFVTKMNPAGSALVYSTYLGGSGADEGYGLAVDAAGSAYVTGLTSSSDFPTTAGSYDGSLNGAQDAFVTKLNAAGSGVVYSTLVGGNDADLGNDVAVDSTGAAYVAGDTRSDDFPTTAGAYATSFTDGFDDAFVTKLNANGSGLAYSTYVGGSFGDDAFGVAVDAGGSAYVTGFTTSTDFPTTAGAYDTSWNGRADAFATKLNAAGSALAYSTFLGGTLKDDGFGIAVDGAGDAYVAGDTASSNFPTTAGAYDTSANGRADAFVTKLNAAGSARIYSTYLGGTSDDQALAVAAGSDGNAYVTGMTASSGFPTTSDAYDTSLGGTLDAYVGRFNDDGSGLAYSSYLGGGDRDSGSGIAAGAGGKAYVTGFSGSVDFPTTAGAYDVSRGGLVDAFLAKMSTGGVGPPASVTLSPSADSSTVGTSHTVMATVTDASAQPVPSVDVRMGVTGSVTTSGQCTTDVAGQCSYAYQGPQLPGADAITGYADANGNGTRDEGEPSGTASETWVLPDSTDGKVRGGGHLLTTEGHRVTFALSAQYDGVSMRGKCVVVDHTARLRMKCVDVTAFVVSGNEVTVYGNALENGASTLYVIHAIDGGHPGKGADSFSILTGSGHGADGTLAGGRVRLLPGVQHHGSPKPAHAGH